MKYLTRILSIVLISICSANASKAQWKFPDPQDPSMPSANAISLGLYGEIPVSYFTGVPDIKIPLYDIKGKKIGLPISLSYNASGLRPDVHPGWVGNGWSLMAGGAITRKVNGHIDEYNRAQIGLAQQGYYFTHGAISGTNWTALASANKYPAFTNTYDTQDDPDVEPDEFDFNFLGYSGKFFLDQNGQWQVQCDKNLTVTFNSSDFVYPFTTQQQLTGQDVVDPSIVSQTFGIFTIRDEQGNQYVFGSKDLDNTAIEFSDVMPPNGTFGSSITATTWYLSKIVSADGSEVINLNYERGPFTSAINYSYNTSESTGSVNMWPFHFNCNNVNTASVYSGNIISPVYLVSITMPTESLEIDFNKSASNELSYSTNPNALLYGTTGDPYVEVYRDAGVTSSSSPTIPVDYNYPSSYLYYLSMNSVIPYFTNTTSPPSGQYPSPEGYASLFIWLKCDGFTVKNVSVSNPANPIIEKYVNFNYNNNPNQRLHLDGLSINDKNDQNVQSYNFSYNPTPLPAYLSTNTDHWGFNNNNNTFATTASQRASVRAPDPTGAQTQAEILTSIAFPTGAITNFTYEPNTYSSLIDRTTGTIPSPGSGIAGGLRIKNITSTDNNGNTVSKNFYYVTGFTPTSNPANLPSSGVLDSKPIYTFTSTGTQIGGGTFSYQTVSSNAVVPLTASSSGTHIGYSTVVEQLSDGSYTTYNFSNSDNGYNDLSPNAGINETASDFLTPTSLAFERGRLLEKTEYNSSGYPVSDISTVYSNNVTTYGSTAPSWSANAVYNNLMIICSGQDNSSVAAVSRTPYLVEYFPFVPIQTISKTYDLNLSGAGSSVTTTTNNTYDQYKNIIEQDVTNSDGTIYKTRFLYPYSFATSSSSNPYTMMMNQNMNNDVIEKIQTTLSNGVENITSAQVYTYQLMYQGGGYNQIYNDAIYNFESPSPVAFSNKTVSSYKGLATAGQLALDSNYVLRGSLNYDKLGNLSSTLDNAGRPTAFLWDYNGSKLVAKVSNANNIYNNWFYTAASKNDIAYTSFEYNTSSELSGGMSNWSGISLGNIVNTGGGVTGHNYYTLTGSTLTSPTLNPSQTYIVSYWSNNSTTPYTVGGSQSFIKGVSLPNSSNPQWTYYQHTVSNASSLNITGTGNIDELRLYPLGALMTSYAWEPLVGLKSTANEKSQITYTSYDNFERLSTISDQTGSIIKSYAYNYASTVNQPVITGISETGGNVTVNFTPTSGCTGTQLTWTDTSTNTTSDGNNGCTSPLTITLPQNGHTYSVTITCYSAANPSGVTSAPVTIVLN